MRRLIATASLVAVAAFTAVAVASKDETVSFNEPQPGGTITAASQSINDAKKVIVGVQGDLTKTAVVVDGGTKQTAQGDAVAACFLAGPGAIPVNNARIRDILQNDSDIQEGFQELDAHQAVLFCMAIVAKVAANLVDPQRAVAAGARCAAKPLVLRIAGSGAARRVTLAKRKAGPKTRYRCRTVAGGIDLTASDSRGRPLRGALGPKLDVGLYKSTDGPPSDGRMSLRYRLR